jgi:hypothetical protein
MQTKVVKKVIITYIIQGLPAMFGDEIYKMIFALLATEVVALNLIGHVLNSNYKF